MFDACRAEALRRRVRRVRPAFASDPKKTKRMMFGRAGLSWLANDLVHEPTPPMTAIANSSRNSAQPGFKRNTQRIREENRDVKTHLLPQQPNNRKKRTLWQRNDRVYFRNELPHRRDLVGRSDCHVNLGTPALDRADRRHAHHGVSQPVTRTDENSKWLQITSRNFRRQINAAFVVREKKIWLRRFPAIVHPEPVFGSAANLLLDHSIYFRRQHRNRSAGLIESFSEHHAPARASGGVNSSGNQRRPRTLGE